MHAKVVNVLGTLAAGLFCVLAVPASAQLSTTANGPYYATPSWDQKLTTNRFVVLANWNNEAVLDRETGLVWERSPATDRVTWFGAIRHCMGRVVGFRKGWRLPSAQELLTLVDPTALAPGSMLVAGHPFVISRLLYWSTTTSLSETSDGWLVRFDQGVAATEFKGELLTAWCVRGGQAPDAQ
jgi:hypothetical protein